MPKPEYNDLYLQLLQLKAQNSKLIYEVLLNKQSWWQKNYGSIITILSIVSSFLVAYKVSNWTFKNQKKIEEEKRLEEKITISQDTFKRIYSELSSTLFEFINKSVLSDFEKLHFQYYRDISYIYNHFKIENQKALAAYIEENEAIINTPPYNAVVTKYNRLIVDLDEKVKDYKEKTEAAHVKMMNYVSIMIDCFNRINKLAYEYDYLKSNSVVIKLIKKFTDNLNGYIPNDLFKTLNNQSMAMGQIDIAVYQTRRDNVIPQNVMLYEKRLKPLLKKIQIKIKEETQIKGTEI